MIDLKNLSFSLFLQLLLLTKLQYQYLGNPNLDVSFFVYLKRVVCDVNSNRERKYNMYLKWKI